MNSKEKMQNDSAILERTPEWKQIVDDAIALAKTIKGHTDKANKARKDRGTPITDRFLAMAKQYPSEHEWDEAWRAMREKTGAKRMPQMLYNCASVIRRCIKQGINGAQGQGKDAIAAKGSIKDAKTYNSLRIGLNAESKAKETEQALIELEKPINKLSGQLLGMHKLGTVELKAAIESELKALIDKMQGVKEQQAQERFALHQKDAMEAAKDKASAKIVQGAKDKQANKPSRKAGNKAKDKQAA